MSDKVTIIVKAASQSMEDLVIDCDLGNTVLLIKEKICAHHPLKPLLSEQRLIYAGHLLQDAQILKTVLRYPNQDNSHILHLVCSTLEQKENSRTVERKQQQVPSSNSSSLTDNRSSSISHSNASTESTLDGLRHRFVSSVDNPSLSNQPTGIPVGPTAIYPPAFSQFAPTFPADPMQQFIVMQQMYAQYMASYMQYMQSGTVESVQRQQEMLGSTLAASSGGQFHNVDGAPQQNLQPQGDNLANQPGQQNAQLRMNALQGGVAEDEEDRLPRDWLEYMYFASRMAILLFIVYFYSTLARFILVTITCFFLYLYQVGWLQAILRLDGGAAGGGDNNDQPLLQEEEAIPRNGDDDVIEQPGRNRGLTTEDAGGEAERGLAEDEARRGSEEGSPGREGELTPQVVGSSDPPRPSLFALSWTFLTTFFSSLLPEQPQIV